MRTWAFAAASGVAAFLWGRALPAGEPTRGDVLAPEAHIEIAPAPPEGRTTEGRLEGPESQPAAERAPPVRPRRRGLVLESQVGILGFAGDFRHVAPPAYWLHTQIGYELADWLMLFGEGELAFTDTSESQDESHTRAFPLWGLGGGARFAFRASTRVAVLVQGELGGLSADVPHDALTILGYRNAESVAPYFGGRVGVEWFQIDRHFALVAQIGARDATGFAKFTASDLSLMWDGGAGVSYTF